MLELELELELELVLVLVLGLGLGLGFALALALVLWLLTTSRMTTKGKAPPGTKRSPLGNAAKSIVSAGNEYSTETPGGHDTERRVKQLGGWDDVNERSASEVKLGCEVATSRPTRIWPHIMHFLRAAWVEVGCC